jgi:hypothetical protein
MTGAGHMVQELVMIIKERQRIFLSEVNLWAYLIGRFARGDRGWTVF